MVKKVEAKAGSSLMEVGIQNDVGIVGMCVTNLVVSFTVDEKDK